MSKEWDDFWRVDESAVLNPKNTHYGIALDTFFNARHFVIIDGKRGEEHTHSYRLQIRCASEKLDGNSNLIADFSVFREAVQRVVRVYNNALLNGLPPFERLQPTTEVLTAVLFQQFERMLAQVNLMLISITLWESPDEGVTYERKHS